MISFPRKEIEQSGFLERMLDFFDVDFLNTCARQNQFIQRSTSRINGLMFLSANVFQKGSLQQTSLNEQCDFLEDEFGVRLSKQSMDERYNTFAVSYMKACFGRVLQDVLVKVPGKDALQTVFGRIRIGDSTSFQLPSKFASFYEMPAVKQHFKT